MTDGEDREHPGVTRIKLMYDRGEFEKLDRMMQFWDALEKLGMLGDLLRRFIIWTGIIAAGYLAAHGVIVDWLKAVSKP